MRDPRGLHSQWVVTSNALISFGKYSEPTLGVQYMQRLLTCYIHSLLGLMRILIRYQFLHSTTRSKNNIWIESLLDGHHPLPVFIPYFRQLLLLQVQGIDECWSVWIPIILIQIIFALPWSWSPTSSARLPWDVRLENIETNSDNHIFLSHPVWAFHMFLSPRAWM